MKLLILSPYFAPYTGVGALRMTSLAAYLVKNGHQVSVIKAEDSAYPPEMATGKRLEGIRYFEYAMVPGDETRNSRVLGQILTDILNKESYDCLLATFGPYDTVRPLLEMRKTCQIPLVVDYRDLWLYDPRPVTTWKSRLVRIYEYLRNKGTEKRLMRACSAFVSITPRSVQTMRDKYPVLQEKSFCVYNGYTPVPLECAGSSDASAEASAVLCVLGKFSSYTAAGAEAFLKAVHRLNEKGIAVQIQHFGPCDQQALKTCEKIGMEETEYLECGQLPYEKAMQAAASATLCAVVINYAEGLGTKVFDYIYLNKPIVAYAPPNSEFEALLQGAENAFVGQTAQQLADAIEKVITEKRTVLTEDDDFRNRFSRDAQNQQYYEMLKTL